MFAWSKLRFFLLTRIQLTPKKPATRANSIDRVAGFLFQFTHKIFSKKSCARLLFGEEKNAAGGASSTN
jgi:hypothetical protein